MIEYIRKILQNAMQSLELPFPEKVVIEAPRNEEFGDIATNIPMLLAKECKKSPLLIAQDILPFLQECEYIEEASVAGVGFINIRFTKSYWHKQFIEIENNTLYSPKEQNKKVLIEFVSANPTGPLHVGHARGAAFGDALRRIFEYAGYDVTTEYYVNDAGNQMRMLGYSVYLRLQEILGRECTFPKEYYKGTYIIDIAQELMQSTPTIIDMEEEEAIHLCQRYATEVIIASIKQDLHDFRVEHKEWFHESTLVCNNDVEKVLTSLYNKGLVYEQDGAWWFASTRYGDDKDRVVKKHDGSYTYFASDIAYHANKVERGYSILFDILGADHHGYIKRLKASVEAVAEDSVILHTPLIQLVSLLREGKPLSMSTRAGTFETLHELLAEVGVDAARFIFLSRRSDSPLEFDLDIVTKKNMDNPVYYVQYAYARIASLLRRYKKEVADADLQSIPVEEMLVATEEIDLIKKLLSFPATIEQALTHISPHYITQYSIELAEIFHRYYARYPLCSAQHMHLSALRLRLCCKVQEALKNSLQLLGVSVLEEM